MKVDKLVGLLFPRNQNSVADGQRPVAPETNQASDEAVTISKSLGVQGSDQGTRAEKLAKLSAQIQSGTYRTDGREVAAKLYSDLF